MTKRGEPRAIRHEYEAHGVSSFYRTQGSAYRNPHEPQIARSLEIAIKEWQMDLSRVLDLAAGSGEATLPLRNLGAGLIDGIDPFTFDAYQERTGQIAGRVTFEQIAAGALAGRGYTLIVCSFAMHLVEPSRLPHLAMQLSLVGDRLLILTPHKRPAIRGEWGWRFEGERVVQRVRSRLYRSTSRGVHRE
ncbi:MAG TPA: class I SAM-dependent methyltransferase [Tepidisphaeraceae bacterium]